MSSTATASAPPPPEEIASFEPEAGFLRRLHHFFHGNPTAIPVLILIIAMAVFSLLIGERFIAPFNLSLIVQQVTVIAVVGAAQTLVILTAGIDLSVGAVMVLASVVMGHLAVTHGVPVLIALPAGFLVGLVCGWINGVLVTFLRLPPFIVTLGTWNVFFALNLWYSGGTSIRSQDINAAAPILQFFAYSTDILGVRITLGSLMMLVLYAVLWFMLNRTAFGRHIYATGDDPAAARLSGINTTRTLVSVYVLAGLICSLAAWALIGRIGSVSPQSGYTANLDSITAVVIGGVSLFGGRGAIAGTLIGALIVGVFRNGLALYGIDVLWQQFTIGLLIIVAVAIDQVIRRSVA